MSEHSQLKLFPMTVQEILSGIPLPINHAELLYREGLISFQPEPAKKLQPKEQAELFRVGMKSLADQARLEIVPALIRGYGGLRSLYEAFRRSRQSESSPADNEPIIQLSEQNAFRWVEEGCRVFR